MRKRLQLTVILFSLCILRNYAQKNDETIKNIIPPSPNAFEMVKYGNMPLNEYQGMAQINIPIAEIKEKSINTSLELNYSKVGVKVDDLPNNAGMNWLLQMGGVITRTVYDRPDEDQMVERLIFDNYSEVNNLANAQDGTNEGLLLNAYHMYAKYDNEIDIFEFSVNGLSGKFYLDKNLKPVLLTKNNPVKIETVGVFNSTHQLIITAIDGTKYYFGGDNAIENTFRREILYYSDNITSFYLTKIQGIDGSIINFNYEHLGPRAYVTARNESMPVLETIQECVFGEPSASFNLYHTYQNDILRVKNAVSLTSISGTEKRIDLHYDHIADANADRITSIDIIDKRTNKKIQQVDFEYQNHFMNSRLERYFLKNIKKYNYDNNNIKVLEGEHSFDYDDPLGLPGRDSYSVDAFGYFNDKNNSTFLPNLNLLHNTDISSYPTYRYADRRSVFEKAKKGTLTSITYPTKGSTHFEYEGLDHKEQITEEEYNRVYSNNYSAETEKVIIVNGVDILDDKLKGRFFIAQDEITSNTPSVQLLKVSLAILNFDTNQLLENKEITLSRAQLSDIEAGYREKFEDFIFQTDKNVKYKLILSLVPRDNINYSGSISVSYTKEHIDKGNLGLRLKRMYDKDAGNNTAQNIKRLYYSLHKDINSETVALINYPNGYLSNKYDVAWCFIQDDPYHEHPLPTGVYVFEQAILSSVPKGAMSYSNYTRPFLFPNVTISYGGDNFEKGGEEKTFVIDQKDNTYILRAATGPLHSSLFYGHDLSSIVNDAITDFERPFQIDGFNGKPLEAKQFSRKDNRLLLQSKTNFSYETYPQETVYDLMVRPVYTLLSNPGYQPNSITTNLVIAHTPLRSYNVSLLNKIEKVYYDEVPLDVEDDSSYKKLETRTEYYYNNPSHNQLTDQKTTFPDGSSQLTNYKYAHEKPNQKLIEANMIGIPLITETTKTADNVTKTISKTETIYPTSLPDAQTGNLLLPKSAYSLDVLTGGISTDVTYNQYDSSGNLLQYTTKSGIPTAIVWGYNNTQPIAKIEGATYSQVSSLAGTIVTASDTDASAGINNDETSLIDLMKAFREGLPNYNVTTYTYDPLVGVRSITPPNGIKQVYIYDTANRLKEVRENSQSGNLLKEYQYNYKN